MPKILLKHRSFNFYWWKFARFEEGFILAGRGSFFTIPLILLDVDGAEFFLNLLLRVQAWSGSWSISIKRCNVPMTSWLSEVMVNGKMRFGSWNNLVVCDACYPGAVVRSHGIFFFAGLTLSSSISIWHCEGHLAARMSHFNGSSTWSPPKSTYTIESSSSNNSESAITGKEPGNFFFSKTGIFWATSPSRAQQHSINFCNISNAKHTNTTRTQLIHNNIAGKISIEIR